MERASLHGYARLGRAKIARKYRQRFIALVCAGEDERIVVAGYRENRQWIVTEGLVELVVIVFSFAEVIDYVSEMVEKRGAIRGRQRSTLSTHCIHHT